MSLGACDLCKREDQFRRDLKQGFRIKGVEWLCWDCADATDALVWRFRKLLWKAEKKFIRRYLRSRRRGLLVGKEEK